MALFDKTMGQLREAFVRARFAEGQNFGRPNIEAWLAEQRAIKQPAPSDVLHEGYWRALFATERFMSAVAPGPFDILAQYATVFRPWHGNINVPRVSQLPPQENPFITDQSCLAMPLLATLDETAAIFFCHQWGAWIQVFDYVGQRHDCLLRTEVGPQGSRLVVDSVEANPVRTATFVLGALYDEWLFVRPKAMSARDFLCDTLAAEIEKERVQAGAEFDAAVAVNADGTKIVTADEVLVIMDDKRARLYSSSAFRERKVLREPCLCRGSAEKDTVIWFLGKREIEANSGRPGLAWLHGVWKNYIIDAAGEDRQLLFIEDEKNPLTDGKRRLVTSRSFCPDPLPEGGVEISL